MVLCRPVGPILEWYREWYMRDTDWPTMKLRRSSVSTHAAKRAQHLGTAPVAGWTLIPPFQMESRLRHLT